MEVLTPARRQTSPKKRLKMAELSPLWAPGKGGLCALSARSTGRQGFCEKQSMPAYEQAGNEEENLARAPLDPFYRKTVTKIHSCCPCRGSATSSRIPVGPAELSSACWIYYLKGKRSAWHIIIKSCQLPAYAGLPLQKGSFPMNQGLLTNFTSQN